jgi:hypothetical protein
MTLKLREEFNKRRESWRKRRIHTPGHATRSGEVASCCCLLGCRRLSGGSNNASGALSRSLIPGTGRAPKATRVCAIHRCTRGRRGRCIDRCSCMVRYLNYGRKRSIAYSIDGYCSPTSVPADRNRWYTELSRAYKCLVTAIWTSWWIVV